MHTLTKYTSNEASIVFTVKEKSFTIYVYEIKDNHQALRGTKRFPLQEYEEALKYFYKLIKIYKLISDKIYFFSLVDKFETRSEEEINKSTNSYLREIENQNEETFAVTFLAKLLEE